MKQKRQGVLTYDPLNKAFKRTERRKAKRGAGTRRLSVGWEKIQDTLCYLSKHTWSHSHPSNSGGAHCLLEARHSGDIMTVAIVCQYWDGYFIKQQQQQQPVAWRGCQRAPSARIGRADVTFSWPSPCWSAILWAGRGDNDMAHSPRCDGGAALCAQCHTWPLTFMSLYLSLSFITSSPWWVSLLSCDHNPSFPCWS